MASGGASYAIDAWSFGLQGIFAEYQQSGFGITGIPSESADHEHFWGASLNAASALGPGISLEGQLAYTQADYGIVCLLAACRPIALVETGVSATQAHSREIDLGTAINF